ncbi:hypothetical protein [Evansella clarkii]|uniref:hypothetical protein n=1 Tax=Evansella clarkii TaxID=79879 RepID=UPI0009965410|nr:hypothetical protein [Evansella clarkii]
MVSEKDNVLNGLTDMFYEVQPDEEYLEEDEDTADDIRQVQKLSNDNAATAEEKIKALADFNGKWFPDGLSAIEQKTYRFLLDQAEKLTV